MSVSLKELSPRELAEIIEENFDEDDLTSMRDFDWIYLSENSDASFELIQGIIYHAVITDKVKVVNFLLLIGITPDMKDREGNRLDALHTAVYNYNVEIARRLIKARADVNMVDKSGMSPMMYAILIPNREMMELLILNKAKLYDKDNNTLLYFAAKNGADIALRFLIENGAYDEMEKHGTEILTELRHCEIGIESQYLHEFETFLEEQGLHPEK